MQDFIACYNPENRRKRKATERFKYFKYDELIARDKACPNVFWLKEESLENLADPPPPDVLQQEIFDHPEAALAAFRDVAEGLRKSCGWAAEPWLAVYRTTPATSRPPCGLAIPADSVKAAFIHNAIL